MKQKFNFVTCWRHFSGEIKVAFSTTKMAPTGGEIKILFHRSKPPVFLHIFILVVSYRPKKTTGILFLLTVYG